MSVLVRGMEMPWCCAECPFISDPVELSVDIETYRKIYRCQRAPEEIEDPWRSAIWITENREEWCPLGDVPTLHGNLIDADEILSFYDSDNYDASIKNRSVMSQICRYAVGRLPNIIIKEEHNG